MQSMEIMPCPDMLFGIIALNLLDWWIACAMEILVIRVVDAIHCS